MKRWPGMVVAVSGASAVALGAFGAHALRETLTPDAMQVWHTAVQYHFWHTLALALAAMLVPRERAAGAAVIAFAVGILLFSGSLYALALGSPHWIGLITPFGGVAFIVGWIALGFALMQIRVE